MVKYFIFLGEGRETENVNSHNSYLLQWHVELIFSEEKNVYKVPTIRPSPLIQAAFNPPNKKLNICRDIHIIVCTSLISYFITRIILYVLI